MKLSGKLQIIIFIILLCTTLNGCMFPGESTEESAEDSVKTFTVKSELATNIEKDAETIMVYMVGSELESKYGNATLDLVEMMGADADTEHNNIVVYTGGASEWKKGGLSGNQNSILLLTKYEDFVVLDSHDSKNMGDADTLSYFINYCYDNFDSENYSLILWNHGAGPVYGFGMDEKYNDCLSAAEMGQALDDSVGIREERLEWIGFDACLMNSLEMADLLSNYSNYLIASQEVEPGWGWNYAFLAETSEQPKSGEEMGKAIIDAYMSFGEEMFAADPATKCDLTLACVDLMKYQAAEDALNSCFAELDADLNIDSYQEMVRNREDLRTFGTYASLTNYGMVDAINLIYEIAQDEPLAMAAIGAIEDMIVYSKSNVENANGISICYPAFAESQYAQECATVQEELDFSYGYRGFLNKYYSIQTGDGMATDWNFGSSKADVTTIEAGAEYVVDTSDISLQLTEEQQANYATADYLILANVKGSGFAEGNSRLGEDSRLDEMYILVYKGNNVELDENGILHGYYGNQVMYTHDIVDDTYSSTPVILIERERTATEIRYTCGAILTNWKIASMTDWQSEAVNLQIVVDKEHPNGIIRSAIPISEDKTNPSKQLLDLDDFSNMSISSRAYYVTRNEDGEMIDFFDWEGSDWYFGFEQNITHDYQLEMKPLQDPENYVCLFRIMDVQGNVSYSEMIPLR